MEVKKSPKANLENRKLTYVLIGFVFALSILYVALEYTQPEIKVHKAEEVIEAFEEEIDIDVTEQDDEPEPEPEPEPQKQIEQVVEEITIVEDDVETEVVDFSSEDKEDEVVDFTPVVIEEEEEEEEVEEVFMVVEKMPEFPGGMGKLMKYFSENVRYPVIAAENGIQGRVICQFTVWKDGSIRDIVVVKGVDKSLDNEAVRLIKNMPKWKPGEQRGKKVSCKYTVPVSFRLQ